MRRRNRQQGKRQRLARAACLAAAHVLLDEAAELGASPPPGGGACAVAAGETREKNVLLIADLKMLARQNATGGWGNALKTLDDRLCLNNRKPSSLKTYA